MTTAIDTDVRGPDLRESREHGPRAADVVARPARRARTKYLLGGLVLVAVVAAGTAYAAGIGKESTDDAQVEGRVIVVSARVPGQVARVLVQDNQLVDAGQIIIELDQADYQAKLEAAEADLESARAGAENARATLALTQRTVDATFTQARGGIAQASSGLSSARASVDQADADLASFASRLTLAELNLRRAKTLFQDGSVAQAEVDNRQAEYDVAAAAVAQAKAQRDGAKAATDGSAGTVVFARGRLAAAETGPQQVASATAALHLADARVKQSEAAKKLAELNLSYTTLRAPRRGVVSRRTVEEGQFLSPERPLLAIVPSDDVWVVANFKEDQLADMHPGQAAVVRFDTYGRRAFSGHVESLAGGSGARFALLPPDNASGNFVKVVQRVPVLVRLEALQVALRPGMSADVTVRTDGKSP
jgi:membrane fusion protein (multidrug efflux system)